MRNPQRLKLAAPSPLRVAWVLVVLCAHTLPVGIPDRYPWGFPAGLVIGALLLALLGVLAMPQQRVRNISVVPAAGLARLCFGVAVGIGLMGLGLGFGGLWAENIEYKLRLSTIRGDLLPSAMILMFCAYLIEGRWVARRLMRRVVGLHVLAALTSPVVTTLWDPLSFSDLSIPWAGITYMSVPILAAIAAANVPLRLPQQTGLCRVCEYDLTGNVSGRCPECGTPIAAGTEAAAPPGPAEVKNAEQTRPSEVQCRTPAGPRRAAPPAVRV